MGKRKKSARKPTGPKKQEKLATTFNCIFCNHDASVTCKIDRENALGYLSCKVCGQKYQTSTNTLTQPIDLYHDWVDATEMVNEEEGAAGASERNISPSQRALSPREAVATTTDA